MAILYFNMVGQTSPGCLFLVLFSNILLPANFNNDGDHHFNVIAVNGEWVFLHCKPICCNNFEEITQYLFEVCRYTSAQSHH